MSPADIKAIIDGVNNGKSSFAWWIYLIYALCIFLSAYLGAYFKAKGQERVLQENFEEIRKRLNQTTKDTEEIKSQLANKSWLAQQAWNRSEQHYVGLLEELSKLKVALEDCNNYFIEPGADELPLTDHFIEIQQQSFVALNSIRHKIGPASLFLSPRAIKALNELVFDKWHLDYFEVGTYFDSYDRAITFTNTALEIVLEEAKSTLDQITR